MTNHQNSPLGKVSTYPETYSPKLLYAMPRQRQRQTLGIQMDQLPFHGMDIWNAYELSWLNTKGKPVVAMAEIYIPCDSENIIESKSLKLYLNSLNQSSFGHPDDVNRTIEQDLSNETQASVAIKLMALEHTATFKLNSLNAHCIDHLDISVNCYTINPAFLHTNKQEKPIEESLISHLLKTNCPVTGQPDWASLLIQYQGSPIEHEGLLKYLISYRQHSDFHEHCVEKIYMDIMNHCQPNQLTVCARYTRRGGLDINPWRSNHLEQMDNTRLCRQ